MGDFVQLAGVEEVDTVYAEVVGAGQVQSAN